MKKGDLYIRRNDKILAKIYLQLDGKVLLLENFHFLFIQDEIDRDQSFCFDEDNFVTAPHPKVLLRLDYDNKR